MRGTEFKHAFLLACRANSWPDFLLIWAGLQKLDLRVTAMGDCQAAERLNLDALAQIPVVRLRSSTAMYLAVPKAAKWEHLWLECNGFLDLRFEDVTTFGKVSLTVALGRCSIMLHIPDQETPLHAPKPAREHAGCPWIRLAG